MFRAVSEEAADAMACGDWRTRRLPEISQECDQENSYDVDEMAVSFKLLPLKSLSFKGEQCTVGILVRTG